MTPEEILKLPSMPAASPSYPMGPYRFINREFMIVTYETDKDLLRQAVPEPLEPNPENQVLYEWIRMPDSSGFGDYTDGFSPQNTTADAGVVGFQCPHCVKGKYQGWNDREPRPCDKCGGSGLLLLSIIAAPDAFENLVDRKSTRLNSSH